jgi:RHS repeat-associated protein
MPATLAENGNTAGFTYGPEHERKIMTSNVNGGITKYYSGSYERQLVGGITRELHYITANGQIVAIFEKKTGAPDAIHYVHTDHLGSLNLITNASGAIEQETSYDAWGNRRDPATLQNYTATPANLVTDRGFTGHEHMDAFQLINMNGRIYDPALGRFLSPDNYVQDAGFTQSYNRYSYCVNNPLIYTDPTGMQLFRSEAPFFAECNWGNWNGRGDNRGGNVTSEVGSGGGGESIFPKYGVVGGPMNDLEYDIQLGQNIANQIGDMSYLNGVRTQVSNGFYIGSGVTSFRYGVDFTSARIGANGKLYMTYSFDDIPSAIIGGYPVSNNKYVFGPGVGIRTVVIDLSKATQSQGGNKSGFDKDKFITYLDNNAFPKYDKATCGHCAAAIRKGLEAGGINTTGRPNFAKNYGPSLIKWGFGTVNSTNYSPIKGDIRVWDYNSSLPKAALPGHIDAYNGTQWESDYKQNGFWPGTLWKASDYEIYRW